MIDVIVLAVVLSLFVFVIDYLSNVFSDTHPEFLPFLGIVRWFVFLVKPGSIAVMWGSSPCPAL